MFENTQWESFKVEYNEFNINKNKPLNEQLDEEENIMRATSGDYLIDVSYYAEPEENGFFTILLVKDGNWNDPWMEKRTNNLKQLEKIVQDFIYMI